MNTESSFERLLADSLQASAPSAEPDGLVASVLAEARHVRRGPRWLSILSESPMVRPPVVLVGSPAARMAAVLASLLLAVVVGAMALLAGGWPTPHLAVTVPTASESPAPTDRPRFSDLPAPSPSEPAPPPGRLVIYTVPVERAQCPTHLNCTFPQMWIANTDGSAPKLLLGDGTSEGEMLGWSADGSRMLYENSRGLVVADATGAARAVFTGDVTCPHPPKDQADTGLDFCTMADGYSLSPDGTRIAFVRGYANLNGLTVVAVLDVATGTITELEATKARERSEQCWASTRCEGEDENPVWSPDGKILAFARQVMSPEAGSAWTTAAIYTIGADGNGLHRVTPKGMYAFGPAWSQDGSMLAFHNVEMVVNESHTSVTDMLDDVYTIAADGEDMRRLTDDGRSFGAMWTSTGRLAFVRDGRNWVMDPDGGNAAQLDFDLEQLTEAGCVVCHYPGPGPQIGLAWWQPMPGG
jgi:hypothetical protein